MSASDSTLIGSEIAGYRLTSLLGRGGMSVVYLAEHLRLGRQVALKLLAPVLSQDDSYRDRFVRESRRAAELDHPNVVPIYDAGEADGQLFIAMRYIEGCDLKTLIRRDQRLSTGRTLFILEQVASALDAAHARDLIHRDVKPGNVLIAEPSEMVYLTDFGVVKHTASRGLTRTGFFIGTVDYAAPEQIEGLPVDARTDVYALGCVLYECLVGKAPFEREAEVTVMHAHLLEAPPLLTAARPDLPKSLNRVLASAMAKSKDDRYDTCEQLIEAARVAALQRSTTTSFSEGVAAAWVADESGAPPDAPAAAAAGELPSEPAAPAIGLAAASIEPPAGATPPEQPAAAAPPAPPLATPPPGGGHGRGDTWKILAAALVAAALAAGAVFLATRDSGSKATTSTGLPTSTGSTTPTGSTAPVTLFAGLIVSDVAAQCKTEATASYGAVETELCRPPANAPISYPESFSFSFFRSGAALLRAYDKLKNSQKAGACGATQNEKWIHKRTGKTGGAVVCSAGTNGESTIVWTHEKLGDTDHVDMLGVAHASRRGADMFHDWWGAVKDHVGKCRPKLSEPVCSATVRRFETSG